MCFRAPGARVGASLFLPAMPEVESGHLVQIPALPLTSQGHLGIYLLGALLWTLGQSINIC